MARLGSSPAQRSDGDMLEVPDGVSIKGCDAERYLTSNSPDEQASPRLAEMASGTGGGAHGGRTFCNVSLRRSAMMATPSLAVGEKAPDGACGRPISPHLPQVFHRARTE